MIRYRCPKCKKALTANDAEAGAKLDCPQCGQRLQVPTQPLNKTILGEIQKDPEVAGTESRQGAFASPPRLCSALTESHGLRTNHTNRRLCGQTQYTRAGFGEKNLVDSEIGGLTQK
jgi:DNA-directed RNA polymerase subunit RPC12/RpoP